MLSVPLGTDAIVADAVADATPVGPVLPCTAALPICVLPEKKLTVPVGGLPKLCVATATLSASEVPVSVSLVMVVLVVAGVMVSATAAEVLALKLAAPLGSEVEGVNAPVRL